MSTPSKEISPNMIRRCRRLQSSKNSKTRSFLDTNHSILRQSIDFTNCSPIMLITFDSFSTSITLRRNMESASKTSRLATILHKPQESKQRQTAEDRRRQPRQLPATTVLLALLHR